MSSRKQEILIKQSRFLLLQKFLSRTNIYLLLIVCLLSPMILVLYFTELSGYLLFFVIISSITALIGGWYCLRLWEQKMKRTVTALLRTRIEQSSVIDDEEVTLIEKKDYKNQMEQLRSSVTKSREQIHLLNLEMDKKLEQMRLAFLEFEDFRQEHERLKEDFCHAKTEFSSQIHHKDSLIAEYLKTMTEQRMIIEKKQRSISFLEEKVYNLTDEVRGLLQLDQSSIEHKKLPHLSVQPQEKEQPPFVSGRPQPTLYDLSNNLHRYVQLAENLTGMDHLGYLDGKSPRFLDPTLDSYAVDRRRLFDRFSEETSGIVFVYSLNEEKFLFVNQSVKAALGWSPEKFMKEFPQLVLMGYVAWKNAILKVRSAKESQARMIIKSKLGNEKSFHCLMGMISKGPFSNHAVGIFS